MNIETGKIINVFMNEDGNITWQEKKALNEKGFRLVPKHLHDTLRSLMPLTFNKVNMHEDNELTRWAKTQNGKALSHVGTNRHDRRRLVALSRKHK